MSLWVCIRDCCYHCCCHYHCFGGICCSNQHAGHSTLHCSAVTIQCHNAEDYSHDFQCYVNLISTLSHGCRALLPSYRPAPDYETAMQQKYRGASQTSANLNLRPNHQIGILYSSQPEIHQTHIQEVSCKIWGSHSGVFEDSRLKLHDAVQLGEWFLAFRSAFRP